MVNTCEPVYYSEIFHLTSNLHKLWRPWKWECSQCHLMLLSSNASSAALTSLYILGRRGPLRRFDGSVASCWQPRCWDDDSLSADAPKSCRLHGTDPAPNILELRCANNDRSELPVCVFSACAQTLVARCEVACAVVMRPERRSPASSVPQEIRQVPVAWSGQFRRYNQLLVDATRQWAANAMPGWMPRWRIAAEVAMR